MEKLDLKFENSDICKELGHYFLYDMEYRILQKRNKTLTLYKYHCFIHFYAPDHTFLNLMLGLL